MDLAINCMITAAAMTTAILRRRDQANDGNIFAKATMFSASNGKLLQNAEADIA